MIVSVIIPAYNRADLIGFTLDSLCNSDNSNIEIEAIVIDDGSTDGTWELVAGRYKDVVLLKNKGKGAGAARNTGLAAAKGTYIMFLDSDDLMGPNYFEQKVALLEQRPELGAVYGRYEYFESNGAFQQRDIVFKHKYPHILSADEGMQHLVNYLGGTYMPSNSIIWRKEFLVKLGGYDNNLAINQDVELFIRAILNGLKITTLEDETRVYIRSHTMDIRVGDPRNAGHKWEQMLALRKNIFKSLREYGFDTVDCYRALSNNLFGSWRELRHNNKDVAEQYLKFAKEVYWPIELKGSAAYRILSKVVGPEQAVKMKYFLIKRD